MRLSDMSKEEYAAYEQGFDDGELKAIHCAFGGYSRPERFFDTPAECEAYDFGFDRGFNSVD